MTSTIFVAGSTGVIGSRLVPLLVSRGHRVFGLTRTADGKADALLAMGAVPVIANVFDFDTLKLAMKAARPDVVMHQLTDLPRGLDASRMEEGIRRNARIRTEGTASLVAAAVDSGARRIVAQSVAWLYAVGKEPHTEDAPLDVGAEGLRAVSVSGVSALENIVLGTPGLDGVVLRYGQIWGPGTGSDDAHEKTVPLHVDGAVWAAALAAERGAPGIYNVAGINDYVDVHHARRELGWRENGWQAPTR